MRHAIVLVLMIGLVTAAFAATPGERISTPKILDNVMFQDFESPAGWNNANPPSGWTIIDNGIADNIWDTYDWHRNSAWTGYAALVSGTSANIYNNDWIITPAVDFSSASACTLSYRHYYDDYLTQSADSALVMLSDNNGDTWGDTVVVYAGADYGSSTVPDSEYFDISSFASGHNQVKAAFQYVKRQAVVTGSWTIDDIKFRADGSSLMSQDFNSGWGPEGNNPPTDWTILEIFVAKTDNNDWHQANITDWGNVADVFWSPIEQQNELLISPSMNFSDGTHNIRLTLKQWYEDRQDNTDSAFILGSINGGASWPETLMVYQGSSHGSSSAPAYDTLQMLSWANYQSDVKIGFKYVGVNAGRWYIDSVNVDRNDMFSNDVRVDSIISPVGTTIEGYSWPVSAVVENSGIYAATFEADCEILDSAGFRVYFDSQAVTILPSLEQQTIHFRSWYAGEPNDHTIKCYTRMFNDMDHSNDTTTANIQTYHHIGHDGPVEGWSYADNIMGDGPLYNWIDIRSQGTEIAFSDPDNANSGMIDMGIEFDYFGQTYSRMAVSTNGWLSFGDSTSTDNTPSLIPNIDGPTAMIALLWSDLNIATGHIYYRRDAIFNRFIVQYDSVEFAASPGSDLGMEIIFEGNDNSIKMQYRYFTHGSDSAAIIGLENQLQDVGLAYDNGQIGQMPLPGLAITFTYLPPHEVKALEILQPQILVLDGASYDIVATVKNVGANTESFEVTAIDDHGFSNTQLVSDLASLATDTVTFPGWTISTECEKYQATVYCNLGNDLNRSNDTVKVILDALPAATLPYIFDDGAPYGGITSSDTTDVIAVKLTSSFENTPISAVTFNFINVNAYPTEPQPDSFIASVFIDDNNDGFPEILPIYTKHLELARSGWTIWGIGCDTALILDCKEIWVGCSIDDPLKADTLALDRNLDSPASRWVRESGQWHQFPTGGGDFMIRAYLSGDTLTQPELTLGSRQIFGASSPNGIDTITSYIQNTGTSCALGYEVSVRQTDIRLLSNRNTLPSLMKTSDGKFDIINLDDAQLTDLPTDPPHILDAGGPDAFGYTWIDSDNQGGPAFGWIDISSMGTPVTWTDGNSDDGYSDPIPMGITFNFYGVNYNSVVISSNGFISFIDIPGYPWSFNNNDWMPNNNPPNSLLAPEWDNLTGGTSGHCYYYFDSAANAFIISWIGWMHIPGEVYPHDFQVILDGMRGTILYQYSNGTYQSDVTVGIENADGTDGLQVVYNQPYLHSNLAILFEPPIFWLTTDLGNGVLPAGSAQFPFNIYMNSADLPGGTYNGSIIINSNDTHEPVAVVDVQFQIEGVCSYAVGDVNGDGHGNGVDVVFMVSYFKGGQMPHDECPPCRDMGVNMIYPQGDVNGSCSWNGVDVVYFVNYFKGVGPGLRYCADCPPGGRILKTGTEDNNLGNYYPNY